MHELGLIKELIDKAKEKGNVVKIVVEVGSLAGIEADHLKEHFKELVDWEIEVKEKKGRVECDCGFKGEPNVITRGHDFVLFNCPWCNDVPKIIEGDEIIWREVLCA